MSLIFGREVDIIVDEYAHDLPVPLSTTETQGQAVAVIPKMTVSYLQFPK